MKGGEKRGPGSTDQNHVGLEKGGENSRRPTVGRREKDTNSKKKKKSRSGLGGQKTPEVGPYCFCS